jgi:hypothetical protein
MANFLPELFINPIGLFHRLSILLPIFKPFPPGETTYRHDSPRKRSTGFASPRHTPSQSAAGFEDLFASHI